MLVFQLVHIRAIRIAILDVNLGVKTLVEQFVAMNAHLLVDTNAQGIAPQMVAHNYAQQDVIRLVQIVVEKVVSQLVVVAVDVVIFVHTLAIVRVKEIAQRIVSIVAQGSV